MTNHVGILNQVEYAGRAERLLDGVSMAAGGSLRGRAGRRPGPGLEVSVGGTPEAVTVQPGVGVVNTDSNGDGSYRFAIDTAVTVELAARPSSGTSRIDLVVVRLYDADVPALSTTERKVTVEVVTGTAGSSPTAPSAPVGSLVVAQLTVPDSGSIAVGGMIARTVAAGSILPVSGTSERNALTGLHAGMKVYREDTGQVDTYDGAAWDDGTWKTYTPTWTSSSTNPTIGNGSITGRWRRIGKTIHFRVRIQFGSTTSAGAGSVYSVTIPATAVAGNHVPVGQAACFDTSANSTRLGVVELVDTSTARAIGFDNAAIGSTAPFPWANGDSIEYSGTYEAAA